MPFPPLISLLLLGLFAVACFATVYLLWPSGEAPEIESMGLVGVESKELSPLVLALKPVFLIFVPLVRWFKLPRFRAWVERQFVTAGMAGSMTVDEYLAYKVLMGIVFWALFSVLFLRVIVAWEAPLIVDLLALGVGTFFPDAWLTGQVSERQESIRRTLPYVLDLLTLSVEAGLDFVAGIHKVCEKAKSGPLVDELSFFLGEMQVGATRQQALRNFALRIDMPEIRSFSAMLIQADLLGASVGPVLRAQSNLLRTQRFQRAERMGAYASQKILFPLILCIMPAVFIVIFGPIALNFIYGDQVIGN